MWVYEVCGVYSRYDIMVYNSLGSDLVQWWTSIRQGEAVVALSKGSDSGQE